MLSVLAAAVIAFQKPRIAYSGFDPVAVQNLLRACRESESWSLVVMHHGKVAIDENFGVEIPACNLMSATKSITSLAVGMLLDDGKIPSLDTPLQYFFPSYRGKWKEKVTIRRMLEHTSGIRLYQQDPGAGKDFPKNRVAAALAAPVVTEPGTLFLYKNRAVDLLAGVVRKASGMPLDDFVWQRLFRPLGVATYLWGRDPDGNSHGSAELALYPRDMAKIGQLMLNKGMWNGKRIVSERYVSMATTASKITENEGNSCGLLWWICDPWFTLDEDGVQKLLNAGLEPKAADKVRKLIDEKWPGSREMGFDIIRAAGGSPAVAKLTFFNWDSLPSSSTDAERNVGFYANGWGGQWILVLPDLDIVAVRTCGDGFFDTKDPSKYEMGELYRLVRALVKTPATKN
ncbi:serine hydrolase domain-containing protein [Fimbriimonas ginsengisoli]|uniref:Beta-lactamase n=1 Tax=Fimbriimonas ginsengisoli Gsoil 348 TaxID=661478 RepID=A0A068NTL7_FIMGI|nr:serine hydrolase [Fimbriimonas ginsengisoli]AIE86075.1 beta-lactamase [Fimbriimonas ginsengisoli Gsoil 348]